MLFKKLFGGKAGGSSNRGTGKQGKAMPNLQEKFDLATSIIHSNDEENIQLAESILLECVKNNVKGANRELGLHYVKSRDPEFTKQGHKMLLDEHERGDVSATVDLGLCWFNGFVGERDYKKAMGYYEEAAKSGHQNAAFNLGVMFLTGQGVNIDFYKARDWFKAADDLGNNVARQNLVYVNEGISIFEEEAAIAAAVGREYFPNVPDREKSFGVLTELEHLIDGNPEIKRGITTVAMGVGVSVIAYKDTQNALVLMRNLAFHTGIPYESILTAFVGDSSEELRDFISNIEV